MVDGLLLLNKPLGITSHDLVDEVRRILRQKRVGHTGILDPAATGLMVMLLGKGTLFSAHLTGSDKRYTALIEFGKATDTYDSEGKTVSESDPGEMSIEEFKNACESFTGKIKQIIPAYSAVKVNGKRMYKSAREGDELPVKHKDVEIYDIDIISFDWPEVTIQVKCGAGTYVRSLAHELGAKLGIGAYLKKLVRTGVGNFNIKQAMHLDELKQAYDEGMILNTVKPLIEAMPGKPTIAIRQEYCNSILEGKPFIKKYLDSTDYKGPGGCLALLLAPDKKVLAIVKLNFSWGSFNRLGSRDVIGKYVRIIDEGHLRN